MNTMDSTVTEMGAKSRHKMTSPDLASLKAIITDPRTDWQCGWTYDEFVQGGFSKRLCEEIATILNAAPALIDELERLRGELATAKTLGAVDELEVLFHHSIFITEEDGSHNRAVTLDAINRRAAELRKELGA